MGPFAEAVVDAVLDAFGQRMGFGHGHAAVEAHMHLGDDADADPARAQVVRIGDGGIGRDDREDLLLGFAGQGLFEQLLDAGLEEIVGDLDDHDADDDGGDGVEDDPAVAEQDGAADADEGADGGERVGTVVPGVGDDGRAVVAFPDAAGLAVEQLLHDDGGAGGDEGDETGRLDRLAAGDCDNLRCAGDEDAGADGEEREADDDG